MKPIETVKEYQVEELMGRLERKKRWLAITFPTSKKEALAAYRDCKNNNQSSKFRVIKIKTTRTIVK
jgi:hypothetical protein